jgi:hypothetical protein
LEERVKKGTDDEMNEGCTEMKGVVMMLSSGARR